MESRTDDPSFGPLVFDGVFWSARRSSAFGTDVEVRVDVGSNHPPPAPSDEQRAAYAAFLAEETGIHQRVEQALFEEWQRVLPTLRDSPVHYHEDAPLVERPEDVWTVLFSPGIFVPPQEGSLKIVLEWVLRVHESVGEPLFIEVTLADNRIESVEIVKT